MSYNRIYLHNYIQGDIMSKRQEFFDQCIAIDTETTGKDFTTAEVIELGYTTANDARNKLVTFSKLYQPESGTIPYEVSGITYIDNFMVAGEPVFSYDEIETQLHTVFKNPIYVAHNSYYDMKVLSRYGLDDNCTWLCTLKLAEKLLKDTHKSLNLPYLRYALHLDVDNNLACHRAGTDALLTMRLLDYFVTKMEEDAIIVPGQDYLPQIQAFLNKPREIKTMPFGKYKGKPLKDVPRSYWIWAIDNMDALNPEKDAYDADLATAINKVL